MSEPQTSKKKVFFIYADDDSDDHTFMAEACSRSSVEYEIKSAFDGAELIDFLNENPDVAPDFLLVDINMPKIDGLTAIRLLRNKYNFTRAPIFVLSTNRSDEAFQRASEIGVSGCYTKPAEITSLKKIIEDITGKSRELLNVG